MAAVNGPELAEKLEQIATQGYCVLAGQRPAWEACGGGGWLECCRAEFLEVLGRHANSGGPVGPPSPLGLAIV
jgi:hypothetical protein